MAPLRIEKLAAQPRPRRVRLRPGSAQPLSDSVRASEPAGRGVTNLRRVGGEEVAGYYTLVVGQVEYGDAPERLTKGLAHHPVPIMLLARLAIATSWQGKGLGSGLLKDAMVRTLQAADIAGIRAFAVHAKDDDAKSFYQRFDFTASPSDPYHLFRLLKDIRAAMKS